jgi:hypothetical protein
MLRSGLLASLALSSAIAARPGPAASAREAAADSLPTPVLVGRILASGVGGASAIGQVGVFQRGGHLADFRVLSALTVPGKVLDPERVLVASSSNFGMPLARTNSPPGAILSLDPRVPTSLVVPASFACEGGQATALDGAVQLLTAQGSAFVNRINNPEARSAHLPAVSNPRGMTINNGFGRPWFASAPDGAGGAGLVSTVDPDGAPRRFSPSLEAGGVFWGDLTNRSPQGTPGSLVGSVGTAFLGGAPDGPRRGLYAVANADGSIVQIHIQLGTEGLAPPGTIGPLDRVDEDGATPAPTRLGMAFNWVPARVLYVADPGRDALVALTLTEDADMLRVDSIRRIKSDALRMPIDLAAAVVEVVNPLFAGNTTLAGGADLYVANRGDGRIVRLAQDGSVRAVRQVEVPGLGTLGAGRLNGIAVSTDARRIFVTVSGNADGGDSLAGAVVELPAFDAASP